MSPNSCMRSFSGILGPNEAVTIARPARMDGRWRVFFELYSLPCFRGAVSAPDRNRFDSARTIARIPTTVVVLQRRSGRQRQRDQLVREARPLGSASSRASVMVATLSCLSACCCASESSASGAAYAGRSVAEAPAKGAVERRMFGKTHMDGEVADPRVGDGRVVQQREGALEPFLLDELAEGLSGFLEQQMDVAIRYAMTAGNDLGRQSRLRQVGDDIGADGREPRRPRV